MEVDGGSDQNSDIRMASHARLKNESMEDEKYHNLMWWLIFWLQYAHKQAGLRSLVFWCTFENLYSLVLYEPRHEKTCLRGLRPGKTQTSLEMSDIETRGIILSRQRTTKADDLRLCCSHMAKAGLSWYGSCSHQTRKWQRALNMLNLIPSIVCKLS